MKLSTNEFSGQLRTGQGTVSLGPSQRGCMERFYYSEFAARETRWIVVEHKIHPRFAYGIHVPLRDPAKSGKPLP